MDWRAKLKQQEVEIRELKKHIRVLHKSLELSIKEQDNLKTILEVLSNELNNGHKKSDRKT